MTVIREGAKDGLAKAIESENEPTAVRVQSTLCLDDTDTPTLRLVNRGRPLRNIDLHVYNFATNYSTQTVRWLAGANALPDTNGIAASASHNSSFDTGAVIEVQVALNENRIDGPAVIYLAGENEVERFDLELHVDVPPISRA